MSLPTLNVEFCNSKSIELFGIDLRETSLNQEPELVNKILDRPRFTSNDGYTKKKEESQPNVLDMNDIATQSDANNNLLSLKDIMLRQDHSGRPANSVESYIMKYNLLDIQDYDQCEKRRSLIVQRMDLAFNDTDCQVINFTDITTYEKLKREEETSRLLKTLNASVHHEMLGPLKVNVDISKRLIRLIPNQETKQMIQTILMAS